MTSIQIIGIGDSQMLALRQNLDVALSEFPESGTVEEVSEFNRINASGISQTPALMVDGEVLLEGNVPSVEEIKKLLQNRQLLQSKLYRMRRILVPVDLSPASENALAFACQIAGVFGASIEVLYAMDSIFEGNKSSPSGFLSGYKKTMQEELDNFVKRLQSRIADSCPVLISFKDMHGPEMDGDTPTIRTHIGFGFAEEVINKYSETADLIVMGTTGRGNITRRLFGSVSVSVSKNAQCPVLLIPAQTQYRPFKNILYASNFDSLDALAIKQTVNFARKFGSQMHFVHVGPPAEQGVDMEKKLFEINYMYSDPEKPFRFEKIIGEDLVEGLHEYAFMHRIDLLIFVTYQRSFWESILHKSMTKEMLLHTSTPVLVIHSDSDGLKHTEQ